MSEPQRKINIRGESSRTFSVDDILAEPDYTVLDNLPKVNLADILDDEDGVIETVPTRIDPVDIDSDTDEDLKSLIAEASKRPKVAMPELIQQGLRNALKVEMTDEAQESDSENLFMALRSDINVTDLQNEEIDIPRQVTNLVHSLKEIQGDNLKEIRQSLDAILAHRQSNEEGKKFQLLWKDRVKANKSVVVGQSIISLLPMEGIANKIREGKMKRSAGVPTVILVCLSSISIFIHFHSFLRAYRFASTL